MAAASIAASRSSSVVTGSALHLRSSCQSRRGEARTTCQIGVVDDLGPPSGGGEDAPAPTRPGRRRARRPTTPPGLRSRAARTRQDPDRVEPVVAGEQRQVRVVVAGLDRDRLPGLERDVRRVADHDVDGRRPGRRRPWPCRPGAGRRRCRPGCARPSAWARLVELHGVHPGAGHLVGHRAGDRAGAGAEVDDDRRAVQAAQRALDRPAGQQLGLRPRHEDAGPDGQLDVAEGGGAGEVLQRLAGRPPRDQRVVRSARRATRVDEDEPAEVALEARGPAARRRRAPGWRPRPPGAGRRPRPGATSGVRRSLTRAPRAGRRGRRRRTTARTGPSSPSRTVSRL